MDIYGGRSSFRKWKLKGKKYFKGLKIAFGPELWWGANPALLVKYQRNIGKYNVAGIFHYDIDQREGTTTSYAIPRPKIHGPLLWWKEISDVSILQRADYGQEQRL